MPYADPHAALSRVVSDRSALLIVDMQPDFMPGGALPVEAGDRLLPLVDAIMRSGFFSVQVATQDWHPPGHASFASSHPGRMPMETIELHGHPQTLWPDHCVQGTLGAALHPDLPWEHVAAIVRKGMELDCDSYSGFRNNWNTAGERPATGLAGYLRERGISDVYLVGLARDVCVKWTAEDGVDAGFATHVLWDATRSVVPSGDRGLEAFLRRRGVHLIQGFAL
jgi:nicotinamidase/pyrazinamidase